MLAKTVAEINEKIRNGQAVVMTAEEVIEFVEKEDVGKCSVAGSRLPSGKDHNLLISMRSVPLPTLKGR